jgi:hypothetical protein
VFFRGGWGVGSWFCASAAAGVAGELGVAASLRCWRLPRVAAAAMQTPAQQTPPQSTASPTNPPSPTKPPKRAGPLQDRRPHQRQGVLQAAPAVREAEEDAVRQPRGAPKHRVPHGRRGRAGAREPGEPGGVGRAGAGAAAQVPAGGAGGVGCEGGRGGGRG